MATLNYVLSSNPVIENRMFGAKMGMLSGPPNADKYTASMDAVGARSIRIGDETHFDITRPNIAVQNNAVPNSPEVWAVDGNGNPLVGTPADAVTIVESLDWAATHNMPVVLSIPSSNMFTTPVNGSSYAPRTVSTVKVAEVKAFVKKLLTVGDTAAGALPDAQIDAIELGNEYWGAGLTSVEYGRLVNLLAVAVQQAMDELGLPAESQPKIIVQMGSPYAREFANEAGTANDGPFAGLTWDEKIAKANGDIIAQISATAKTAIDGLVEHYYHTEIEDVFDNSSLDMHNIDVDWAQWAAAGYQSKDLYITEWNNKQDNPFTNHSQFGLKGAGVMVEQVENMVRMGVDAANVWPFQHNFTNLVDGLPSTPKITPRGFVFSLMSEFLPGTQLLESNLTTASGLDYELNAYASRDKYVFFISSRTNVAQTVTVDLSPVVTSSTGGTIYKVGYDPTTSDGKFYADDPATETTDKVPVYVPGYQDPEALGVLTASGLLGAVTSVTLDLDPYEVGCVVLTAAQWYNRVGTSANETLAGAAGHDSMLGNSGNDVLNGLGGDDTISGGIGNDVINAGRGNDNSDGGSGTDTIVFSSNAAITVSLATTAVQATGEGYDRLSLIENVTTGNGNDNVTGSSAANVIVTGLGNDSISAGAGNDSVNAGDGNDYVTYTSGADTVDGGAGVDRLIFTGTTGAVVSLQHLTNGQNMTITGIENLTGGTGNDSLLGDGGNNNLIGNDGNDTLAGYAGDDSIYGGNGNDLLWGWGGNDIVAGFTGNDTIVGYDGTDTLTGGTGDDLFRYQDAAQEADVITDFGATTGNNDRFSIDASGFAGGLVAGSLAASQFILRSSGSTGLDSDDRFVFNTTSKALYFDVDGLGGTASVLIATLQSTAANLTAGDIWLF